MNIKNIFLVLVAIILLSPSLLFFSNTNRDENGNVENQAPLVYNPKRPFEMFDNYYKYNFAFRNFLSKQYLSLKNDIANVSSLPDKVINGKEGWYFLGNSYNNVFSESLGVVKYDEKEIQTIADNILEMNRFCDSLGVKFYYFAAPNSNSIYKEFLPLKSNDKLRRIDLVKNKLEGKFNIIDTRKKLISKKTTNRLYYKTDTHWNENGAFIGVQELVKVIQKDFNTIPNLDANSFNIEKESINQMDLTKMLGINVKEETFIYNEKIKSPILVKNDTIDRIPYIYAKNSSKKLKGYMYRDSFATSMIPFMNTLFGEMTYVSTSKFDKQRIIAEKPDFVVFEVVERDMSWTQFK